MSPINSRCSGKPMEDEYIVVLFYDPKRSISDSEASTPYDGVARR